jgi:hypothetical protein
MNYISKIRNILTHLDSSIKERSPFSLIRFGDGGIKAIHAFLFNDSRQLLIISKKEGIPLDKFDMLIEGWASTARHANYIDTQEMYFDSRFWKRLRNVNKPMTPKTKERMLMWDDLYGRLEFENYNYCNPESNYLSVLRVDGWVNILDIMRKRRVCVITAKPEIKSVLSDRGYDADIIKIVGHYEDQYKNSYEYVMKYIEQKANSYDLWLVAAGELGRLYSGAIKENGGRCFDIGFIIEFWLGQSIHPRLKPFMKRSISNSMELRLTNEGNNYKEFI